MNDLEKELSRLRELNPHIAAKPITESSEKISRVLVAGDGLIAKRMVLALNEEGISSIVPVRDTERGRSWYEFVNEPVFIGSGAAGDNKECIIAAAILAGADAVYPAYDFLRMDASLADDLSAAAKRSILVLGPEGETLRRGMKLLNPSAREADSAGVVVQMLDGEPLAVRRRGADIQSSLEECGPDFPDASREQVFASAREFARESGLTRGTAALEFAVREEGFVLRDFRPGLEAGCAVIEQALGIDLALAHVRAFFSSGNGGAESTEKTISASRFAIGCRVHARPNPRDGRDLIRELEHAGSIGVRIDFVMGQGDRLGSGDDILIGECIVKGPTRQAALIRLERALRELYLRGVRTNLNELLSVVRDELSAHEPSRTDRGNDDSERPAIFGAFAEYLASISGTAERLAVLGDPARSLTDPDLARSPTSFRVIYDDVEYRVDFLRMGLTRYSCYVDEKYHGDISLTDDGLGHADDYGILYANRSLRLRVDRTGPEIVIFMRDTANRARYLSMRVAPGDSRPSSDLGRVRAPLQGTFVRFGETQNRGLRVGDVVSKGDVILVLSSMKMETAVKAPTDGVVTRIIEEGLPERLTLGNTPDGRTIGRPISEGELLAVISAQAQAQTQGPGTANNPAEPKNALNTDPREYVFSGAFVEHTLANFAESLPFLLELAAAYFRGYIQQEHVIIDLIKILDENLKKGHPEDTRRPFTDLMEEILLQYGGIRRLFSPALSQDISYFGELGAFAYGPNKANFKPSPPFQSLIDSLFSSYGIKRRSDEVFLLFQRAYYASREHPELLRALLDLSYYKFPKNTALFLGDFMNTGPFARLDLDRALLEFMQLKKRMRRTRGKSSPTAQEESGSEARFNTDGNAPSFPPWAAKIVASVQERENAPRPVPSPRESVVVLAHDEDNSYLAITWADETLDGIRGAYREGLEALAGMVRGEFRENNRLEILVAENCELDLIGRLPSNPGVISRSELRDTLATERISAGNVHLAHGLLRIGVRTIIEESPQPREVIFQEKRGTIQFEYLSPADPRNPHASESLRDPRDAKVFAKSKWPVEAWALLAFDGPASGESLREVLIPSIDGGANPVGAKIYAGMMRKSPALFFMKDSRVKGGATGNLEGLKYVAAIFLARRHGTALYIWNDGAGANIKEGIPALNRAAQGFMMNAIFAAGVSEKEFEQYTAGNHDESLRELFAELDKLFAKSPDLFGVDLPPMEFPGAHRPLLAAVGTGSSAGLDVYGSSQAVLQLMLDSEQSYRVLTGSNVVRAVTGEDISNYDIGGAEVMGGLTGIVDRVAENKLELLDTIRRLHDLFARREVLPEIRRIAAGPSTSASRDDRTGDDGLPVLSEKALCREVDDGEFFDLKSEYREAGSLVGGFARLAGRRVLILGPRGRFGLRGAASTIRGRELMRMANRTGTPRLLVFGRRWFQRISRNEPGEWRARSDFMRTLYEPEMPQINIVTHPDGMQAADLNSRSDLLIYVRGQDRISRFVRENAAFITDTRSSAFDLAGRLMGYLEGAPEPDFREPAGKPGIPEDITRPYDIIETVILPVVDRESFLEVFREMNHPVRGPSLVTGFARMAGKVVGIIADQPLIMGGAPDAPGTEKFRVFTELLNRFNIPLIMLSNAPGFMPGTRQERLRIQAVGGESLDVNVLGHIPVVSVVLNQNYGGRLIHAFGKHLRPGIVYIAPPDALLAVMGASAAFDLFYGPKFNELMQAGQKEEAGELHRKFFAEFNEKSRAGSDAAATGSLDWMIPEIAELRDHLLRGIETAANRCREVFGT